ncbi:hypothetical protein Z949_2913 [Sulfitobacter guttiformis KCTC 32187]|nr:hypothetical protein Z949_2913 [Sulfitobacter guttiformis KCTC 32187]
MRFMQSVTLTQCYGNCSAVMRFFLTDISHLDDRAVDQDASLITH